MNLILLRDHELVGPKEARLVGDRARHLLDVVRCEIGSSLRVGKIDGPHGIGVVRAIDDGAVVLDLTLDRPAEPAPDIDLLLALPRPKVLRRILEHVATLGVRRIVLVNSWRVDKSYFETKLLEGQAWREPVLAGLEQARATRMPELHVFPLFKPFVEDRLDELLGDSHRLVLHPGEERALANVAFDARPVCLAIGPEGGWLPYEVEKLEEQGFHPTSLGDRTLRVETAVTVAFAQLALLRR